MITKFVSSAQTVHYLDDAGVLVRPVECMHYGVGFVTGDLYHD